MNVRNMPEGKHFYEFGTFRLDPAERLLVRDGKPVPLSPKAFETLLLLVENSGHLLKKDEIMKRVWPDAIVEEVNLAHHISAIRRALETQDGSGQYIETVPKGGYRWVAETRKVPREMASTLPAPAAQQPVSSPESPISPTRDTARFYQRLIASFALLAIAAIVLWLNGDKLRTRIFATARASEIHSIAVLPLKNLSTDPSQEYFSDGMTDELITNLAKISKLQVISHTSVERYKGTKLPLPKIAKELGVDAVVEGQVMRSGDRVRITAQLIDARSDRHLWADSYERDLRDVLSLQDKLARQIASEVGIKLTNPPRTVSAQEVTPAVHDAYLKGNFYWDRLTCDGFNRGREYFQQAVDQDPNFALAYVGLAQSYFTLGDWGCVPSADVVPKAKTAALKAAELNPDLGAPHAWLGKIAFFYEWNWTEAEKELNRAIELDPNYVYAHLIDSVFLVTRGNWERGFAEMRRALELDPTSELTNVVSTFVLYLAHDYDRAIEQGKKTVELYPNSPAPYVWLAAAYEQKGMNNDAFTAYLAEKSFEGVPARELAAYRSAYRKSGIRGYWQMRLQATKKISSKNACGMAAMYAHLGEKESTLELLNEGLQQHCSGIHVLNVDPQYDIVRNEPEFKALLNRLRM